MKITAKDRAWWLGREDTEIRRYMGGDVSRYKMWNAEAGRFRVIDGVSAWGKTKFTAINAAIRAERAAKKGKR